MKTKLTNEMIEAGELYSLGESLLDGCLELNNEFVRRYCGDKVAELLLQLPEKERAFALEGCLGEGYLPHGICEKMPEAIWLPCDEIEVQFEGDPAEYFETPEDLTIHGDLAYLYTGYGAVFNVDCRKLAENVADMLATD